MPDIKQVNFRLPQDIYEALRLEAFERRVPMNQIIVEILEERYPVEK